jgi:hypothetical protein
LTPLISSAAFFDLGLLLAGKNRMSEAEQALRRALDADSANVAAAYNLCVILRQAGWRKPSGSAAVLWHPCPEIRSTLTPTLQFDYGASSRKYVH